MKITFISNFLYKKNKGQTLIEAIITLGIALIIITSVVALVNSSNRRATQARQATQASKLAQEGMEIVRNIRDVNDPKAIQNTALCNPDCSWSDLYTSTIGTQTASLQRPPSCGVVTESWCLEAGTETIETIFTRSITISDDDIGVAAGEDVICADPRIIGDPELGYSDIKRIIVTVSWDSPIGNQQREVVSCLSKL